LVRNVHFKQAARKHRPVNQHYFIFQILTEKKSLPTSQTHYVCLPIQTKVL